jgi:hypothetical protein
MRFPLRVELLIESPHACAVYWRILCTVPGEVTGEREIEQGAGWYELPVCVAGRSRV